MNPAGASAGRRLWFTDLDGTLLECGTYSPATARPALARLVAAGVQVVFCSSKTAAEQRALRAELGLPGIWEIVENGAAITVPGEAASALTGEWVPVPEEPARRCHGLGLPRAAIVERLARVQARTGLALRGYRDLTDEALAALTGLPVAVAGRARQRDYSETLVDDLPDEAWRQLAPEFAAEGLECRHGGRFHTVTGAGTDKGAAVRWLTARAAPAATVGVGDSANDRPLLAAVQQAFLVARPDGTWAELDLPGVTSVAGCGPAGFVAVAARLLARGQG